MNRRNNLKGFTLIELLIVVAIIAILAAIAVPNFLEAQTRAKVSRTKADMRSLATAIESYAVDNNVYPIIVGRGGSKSGPISGPSTFYAGVNGISSRLARMTTPIAYITSVFTDPFIAASVRYALDGGSAASPPPPLPEYDTFDYVDAKSLSPSGVLGTGQIRAAGATSGGAWQVVGCGPDKMDAFGGGPMSYTLLNHQRGVDYDPTNGTLSVGDVVRIGGTGQLLPQSNPASVPSINRVTGQINF